MYALAEYEVSRNPEGIGSEAAKEQRAALALAEDEARPYVVRDLSWELARFLDTQDLQTSPIASPIN